MYRFSRVLEVNETIQDAINITPGSPLWLIWASCESNLTLAYGYHGPNRVKQAIAIDLFTGACPDDCNGHGVCTLGLQPSQLHNFFVSIFSCSHHFIQVSVSATLSGQETPVLRHVLA